MWFQFASNNMHNLLYPLNFLLTDEQTLQHVLATCDGRHWLICTCSVSGGFCSPCSSYGADNDWEGRPEHMGQVSLILKCMETNQASNFFGAIRPNTKYTVFCYRLKQMLEAILSTIEGTDMWNATKNVIPLFEKLMERMVKDTQAESGANTTDQQKCCFAVKSWIIYPEKNELINCMY